MSLDSLILRWIARSSDALVRFIVGLDARLDEFLLKADDDVAGFEDSIGELFGKTEKTKAEIEAQAEAEKAAIEAAAAERKRALEEQAATDQVKLEAGLAEAQKTRAILINMKQSLPKGE